MWLTEPQRSAKPIPSRIVQKVQHGVSTVCGNLATNVAIVRQSGKEEIIEWGKGVPLLFVVGNSGRRGDRSRQFTLDVDNSCAFRLKVAAYVMLSEIENARTGILLPLIHTQEPSSQTAL